MTDALLRIEDAWASVVVAVLVVPIWILACPGWLAGRLRRALGDTRP